LTRFNSRKAGWVTGTISVNILLSFIFGIIFLTVILGFAAIFSNPTPFQERVFLTVLALAAGGVGAMLPGFLEVEHKPLYRAGGALALVLIVFFFKPAILNTTQNLNAAFNQKTAADVTFEPTIWYDANMKGGWDVRIQNPVDSEVSLSGAFVVPSGVEGQPPTAFPLYRLIPDRMPPRTSTTVQALLWERGVDNGVSRTNLTFLFHNRQSIRQQSQPCNLCLDFRDINGGSGHKCYDFQCTRIPLPTAP